MATKKKAAKKKRNTNRQRDVTSHRPKEFSRKPRWRSTSSGGF